MKPIVTLSLLALAPLLARAEEKHVHKADGSCCSDMSKFVETPAAHAHEGENPRVVLKPNQVTNLGLKTEPIGPAKIARTAFALGEILSDPRGESAAAVRVPGRIVELRVALGDTVKAGDTLALVESRQSGGDPARIPVVALADGTVDEVLAHHGEPVSPDTPILRLADHTRLVAIARIPQSAAAALKPGETVARITPEGAPARELVLTSIDPHADPVNGTVTARFAFANKDGALSPGRRAEFRVILSEKDHPVTVPRASVEGDHGDLFVFIENAPGIYEKHPVVLGDGDENRVAVTGPDAGERVVVQGAGSLRYADASPGSPDAAHGHTHSHDEDAHADMSEDDSEDVALEKALKHTASHEHAGHSHAEKTTTGGKTALQAELDAAHGHAHGPNGEELGEHAATAAKPGFFSGDSGAAFFGTLAAGEALLLALALNALRKREKKEDANA